jgi:ABC-type polysaccharide/polyol phosphate export permease
MNPMAPIVEGVRVALLGSGPWTPQLTAMIGISAGASLLMLLLGATAFLRVERTIVDTL